MSYQYPANRKPKVVFYSPQPAPGKTALLRAMQEQPYLPCPPLTMDMSDHIISRGNGRGQMRLYVQLTELPCKRTAKCI